MMNHRLSRRDLLRLTGVGVAGLSARGIGWADGEDQARPADRRGAIAGHAEGAQAGLDILAAGGNAVDAAVTAALVGSVVAGHLCGPGGYGGHMVIARPGKKVTAIDFNMAAPRAARPDMFLLAADGQVRDRINQHGWLAAGVPGTLAGLQLALDRYGKLPFSRVAQPAIRYAREGFEVSTGLAAATRSARARLASDLGSARLLLPDGEPLKAGSRFRNLDLATLLETLAERNSVESFYRGDIAERIAAAFKKHGGLATAEDLAAYRAREVDPLELRWQGFSVWTAPLTAGGVTVLQALSILKALNWEKNDSDDPRTTHLRVEVLRSAWGDRLRLLGDPEKAQVPLQRLLSEDYSRQVAARIQEAVRQGRALPAATDGRPADGTMHLSVVDSEGMMVAVTLTHGGSFGAQVTVDGLGLTLGHGMSRFDPRPDHPNTPGPGKRPLHNMCPTIVLQVNRPVLALGGRGGRRIPNAVFDVLAAYVGRQASFEDAMATPRLHTEGGMNLVLERSWPEKHLAHLRQAGYQTQQGASAIVHAVTCDLKSGAIRSAGR